MKKKITKVPKFKDFKTTRATSSALEKILYKQIPILDHGFIRVIDYMGTDQSIVQAARALMVREQKNYEKTGALLDIC